MQVPTQYVRTKADHAAIEAGCYWDQEQADRVIRFAETYFAPQFIGGKFKLLPWQVDWLSQCYGWRLPDSRRRWRKCFLTMAKKNGKSLLSSIVALYEALAAGVPSPLVVSCSTTRENARQIYDEVRNSITSNGTLKKLAKIVASQKIIRFKSKNGEFRSISNEAGNAEGLNLSACICDEVHAWQNDRLYRTLEYATVARDSGIMVIVSTAGSDQGHFFYDLYQKARNIQEGSDTDTSFFGTIYECPEGKEDTEEGWRAANPSLGVSFSAEDFRRDIEAARKDTSSYLSAKRYRLNMWCRASDSYIGPDQFDPCLAPMTDAELTGLPLFVGCDLAQTTDMCSLSLVWCLGDRRFYVRNHSWVCEEGVRRRELSNLPRYQQYAADGVLSITPGTANDYRAIRRYILDIRQRFDVRAVVFDQFNALEMAAELMADGLQVERQPQNHRYFNGAVKEFEVAIREKRIRHDGNRLLRWALQNTRLDINTFGDAKPSREKSTDKIDPAVSTLMAYGRAVTEAATGRPRASRYDNAGIMTL